MVRNVIMKYHLKFFKRWFYNTQIMKYYVLQVFFKQYQSDLMLVYYFIHADCGGMNYFFYSVHIYNS